MIPSIDTKPPGKKLIKQMSAKTKSIILAPTGLILLSLGLMMLTETAHQRRIGEPLPVWMLLGIYSLALINFGVICVGMAVRFRILSDVRRETRRSIRQLQLKMNTKPQRRSKTDKKAKSPTKNV
tara:strand:- start:537 stop:911 length:375 start_codon:yes stop_codon:yes gene_type:complete